MAVEVIIYPVVGSNSFISVADANTVLNSSLDFPEWDALDEDTQARWLIFAYQKFFLLKDFVPPADLIDSCLPEANAVLALHSLKYDSNDLRGEQQVRVDKVGPLYNEFFKNEQLDRMGVNDFPLSVVRCLQEYGVEAPNVVNGIGSFKRTR